ncbi:MAG: hypothetical protein CMJ62_16070 [Planctomycetaceae bacterium]|nr:hypothetical protein [Planctomycetaceae bacterium]
MGYISLAQARLLAMQTARETPGNYGRRFVDTPMALTVDESGEDEDYYTVILSFKPEAGFTGTPGREQFFVSKEGEVALRQVLGPPRPKGRRRVSITIAGIVLGIAGTVLIGTMIFDTGPGPFGTTRPVTQTPAPTFTAVPNATSTPDSTSVPTSTEIPVMVSPAIQAAVPTSNIPSLPSDIPLATPATLLTAPNFEFTLYQGEDVLGASTLQLSELLGNPIVLNFWGGLSPPSHTEMPILEEFYEENEDQVYLLGIDLGQFTGLGDRNSAQALIQELNLTYPAGFTDDSSVLRDYNILGMPTTVFINSQGEIFRHWGGALNRDVLTKVTNEMMQSVASTRTPTELPTFTPVPTYTPPPPPTSTPMSTPVPTATPSPTLTPPPPTGLTYLLTSKPSNWQEAEDEAVALGGHLVTINDAAEQHLLIDRFLSGRNYRSIYWIGLTDRDSEGNFTWVSGEPVTYTFWNADEPNNQDGNEDYVVINWHFWKLLPDSDKGDWNDVPLEGNTGNHIGIVEIP